MQTNWSRRNRIWVARPVVVHRRRNIVTPRAIMSPNNRLPVFGCQPGFDATHELSTTEPAHRDVIYSTSIDCCVADSGYALVMRLQCECNVCECCIDFRSIDMSIGRTVLCLTGSGCVGVRPNSELELFCALTIAWPI